MNLESPTPLSFDKRNNENCAHFVARLSFALKATHFASSSPFFFSFFHSSLLSSVLKSLTKPTLPRPNKQQTNVDPIIVYHSMSSSPSTTTAAQAPLPLHIRIFSSLIQFYHESLGRKAVQSGKDATVEATVDFSKIRYSQVWEDTRLLRQGLRLKPQSRVLSIASAGDNAFALLLDDAREVVAIGKEPMIKFP